VREGEAIGVINELGWLAVVQTVFCPVKGKVDPLNTLETQYRTHIYYIDAVIFGG
jgi:hypothetical protein